MIERKVIWTYCSVIMSHGESMSIALLNTYGRDGWEYVGTIEAEFIFKRQASPVCPKCDARPPLWEPHALPFPSCRACHWTENL